MRDTPLRRIVAGLFAVGAVITMIAACGSSSSSSSQAAPASSSSTTPAGSTSGKTPSGAAIKVGMICSCSGIQAASISATGTVAKVWAQSVNAAGGINGHPVSMAVHDDAGNATTSLQDAKTLVEQDHVMAIVGEYSVQDSTWASYVASKGIPVVGGISPEAPFLTNPDFFPSGTQLVVQTVGTIALAKTAGKTHIGVMYCAESPICAELVPLADGAAALSGLKVTTEKISSTAPSYAAPCLSLKSAGADSLFVADNSAVVLRVVDGCVQQGYSPLQVSQTSATTNAWKSDANLNGSLLAGYNANPFDSTLPGTNAFNAAVTKYAPGLLTSSAFTSNTIAPWAAGELFQAAATVAHITPTSTGAEVKKGLYALKNETLGGIAPPLNFTPGKPAFVPCYFTQELKGGKFLSLNNNKPTCLTVAQSAALIKALHL